MKIKNALGEDIDIEVGDEVQLSWYGDSNVPKYLSYSWAKVEQITNRGNLVVKAALDAYGTRTIIPQRHVGQVKKVSL